MKKRVINLVMVMVLLIGLVGASTGCGASDQTTWEKIQSEGKFTFACSGGYPPFNYTNDQGDLIGFDVEIAQALGDVMGVEAEGITTEWDGILGGLTGLRFDTVIGSMAITDDRLEQVSFTDPYYYDGAQFFSVEANGYTGLDDPKVATVGVVTGTTFESEIETYENVTDIMNFSSDEENFITTDQGRTDGFVTSRFVGLEAPEDYGFVATGSLLYTENIGIAVRKEDTELLKQLNEALATIVENGTYEEISMKYFGYNILQK